MENKKSCAHSIMCLQPLCSLNSCDECFIVFLWFWDVIVVFEGVCSLNSRELGLMYVVHAQSSNTSTCSCLLER